MSAYRIWCAGNSQCHGSDNNCLCGFLDSMSATTSFQDGTWQDKVATFISLDAMPTEFLVPLFFLVHNMPASHAAVFALENGNRANTHICDAVFLNDCLMMRSRRRNLTTITKNKFFSFTHAHSVRLSETGCSKTKKKVISSIVQFMLTIVHVCFALPRQIALN